MCKLNTNLKTWEQVFLQVRTKMFFYDVSDTNVDNNRTLFILF